MKAKTSTKTERLYQRPNSRHFEQVQLDAIFWSFDGQLETLVIENSHHMYLELNFSTVDNSAHSDSHCCQSKNSCQSLSLLQYTEECTMANAVICLSRLDKSIVMHLMNTKYSKNQYQTDDQIRGKINQNWHSIAAFPKRLNGCKVLIVVRRSLKRQKSVKI